MDFPHAAERFCQLGDVVLREGTAATATWRSEQLHRLKQDGVAALVPSLRTFAAEHLMVPLVAENLSGA